MMEQTKDCKLEQMKGRMIEPLKDLGMELKRAVSY